MLTVVVCLWCPDPTDRELGEQMSAALYEAVGRQDDDKAYLITPPQQMDSPRDGKFLCVVVFFCLFLFFIYFLFLEFIYFTSFGERN